MDVVTFLLTRVASTEGFVVGAGLITAYLFARHGKKHALRFLACAVGLMLAVIALKEIFHIARPEGALIEASGYAFPSGHAAGALFLALSLCYLTRRVNRTVRYGIWAAALLLAFLIGASRIAYGVHTPFQVIAGYMVGALFVFVFFKINRK